MLSGVCWGLLQNALPYLLFQQGEVWSFSVVPIHKYFFMIFCHCFWLVHSWTFSFHLEFHSFHNTVLSNHNSVHFSFFLWCNSIYLLFHRLLEFAACLYLPSVLFDTWSQRRHSSCHIFASQWGLLAYLILALPLSVSSLDCSSSSHTGSEPVAFFFSSSVLHFLALTVSWISSSIQRRNLCVIFCVLWILCYFFFLFLVIYFHLHFYFILAAWFSWYFAQKTRLWK